MRKPWRSASSAERHVESPSSLSRSKPESRSIRGRISNPIPIPGPMDDEFPMRNPGSTMVVQVAEPDSSNSEADVAQRQTTREPTAATPSSASVGDTQVVAQAASREPERAGSAHETTTNETGISIPTHDSSPNGTAANYGGATAINNGNVNVRYSTFSTSTTRETPQHTKPQRKKSTLRGVFSKLFGRKKGAAGRGGGGGGGQVASGLEYGSTPEGSRQHHSDPASWTHPAEEGEGGGEGVDYSPPKRSNSMPLADYGRALRSHAVASRDRLVIESARNSAVLEHSFSKSRRGGSGLELPPPAKYRGLSDESMSGLSPRPASTSARHSRSPEPGQESQDDTGTGAGTAAAADNDDGTPARTTSATNILHRRSQSLSVLQKSQRLGFRRMSSEALRYYWRDSLDADNSDNKSPLGSPRAAESVGERYPDEPPTPVRPFAFDDLEMAGMKITEAVSVTNRVTSLEARSKKLEKVVTKLCMALPPPPHHHAREKRRSAGMATTTTTTTTTRAKPNVSQTSHHHHHHHHRHSGHPPPPIRRSSVSSDSSFENEAPLPPGYLGLPFASNTGGGGSGAQPAPGRPLSTSTIRGVASLPALSQQELQRPLTYDHYGNLMALVETERSARIALEAQVRDLRRQVQLLSRAAAAGRRDGEGGHSYSEQSAFDYDDDDDDDDDNDEDEDEEKSQPPPSPPPRRRGKAGLVPNDSGLGGSVGGGEEEQQQQRAQAKAAASTDDYDEYSEAYATPYESGGGGVDVGIHDDWGAAVEGSDEEGAARRKAARTMSLSQMTMGSRQQQQQQQQQGSRVA